jgi:hypothetical protein
VESGRVNFPCSQKRKGLLTTSPQNDHAKLKLPRVLGGEQTRGRIAACDNECSPGNARFVRRERAASGHAIVPIQLRRIVFDGIGQQLISNLSMPKPSSGMRRLKRPGDWQFQTAIRCKQLFNRAVERFAERQGRLYRRGQPACLDSANSSARQASPIRQFLLGPLAREPAHSHTVFRIRRH